MSAGQYPVGKIPLSFPSGRQSRDDSTGLLRGSRQNQALVPFSGSQAASFIGFPSSLFHAS